MCAVYLHFPGRLLENTEQQLNEENVKKVCIYSESFIRFIYLFYFNKNSLSSFASKLLMLSCIVFIEDLLV